MTGESPEARTARVLAAQDQWVPRHVATDPAAIMAEWMTDPENRMSALANRLADPAMESSLEVEVYREGEPPIPGGLRDRMARLQRARMAQARAELDALNATLPPSSRIY
jgi:hypothetical protein